MRSTARCWRRPAPARRPRSRPRCRTRRSSRASATSMCARRCTARTSRRSARPRPLRSEGAPNERAHALADCHQAVLNDAIRAGGSSLRDHRRTDGELGDFQHNFRVYDRDGEMPDAALQGHDQAHRAGNALDVFLSGVPEVNRAILSIVIPRESGVPSKRRSRVKARLVFTGSPAFAGDDEN